jgi:hypothetical protein
MIYNFLNKKNSLKNISNQEFDSILPKLAEELSQVDYCLKYNDEDLFKDWKNLNKWKNQKTDINSTSRIGMKLCEHFFPNFYNIENNKGVSFAKLWKDSNFLEKVLVWNRKSHSTPYLSELKRGVYFCGGLAKSTMYRPQMAKIITRDSKVVLDPCAGWGGRLLGSVSNNCYYYAFEPNQQTFNGLNSMVKFLGIENNVKLICDDALNMEKYNIPKVDTIITSPPYFDLEVYCDSETQSINGKNDYVDWENNFLFPLVENCLSHLNDNGKSCWNVANFKKNNMWNSINNIHNKNLYYENNIYQNKSSPRPTSKLKIKSNDCTIEYARPI